MVIVLSIVDFFSHIGFGINTDLLRLSIIPIFAYAAYLDIKSRRIPSEIWHPVMALGLLLLMWDMMALVFEPQTIQSQFLLSLSISVIFTPVIVIYFWEGGVIGSADMKGILALALFFPQIPAYTAGGLSLPIYNGVSGIFAIGVFFNAIIITAMFHIHLIARNIVEREFNSAMYTSSKTDVELIPDSMGEIRLQGIDGGREYIEIDTVRKYLRWRNESIDSLCENALEIKHNPPQKTDSSVNGVVSHSTPRPHRIQRKSNDTDNEEITDGGAILDPREDDTEWAAEAFIKNTNTQTDPITLRQALDTITTESTVWVSPSIPFFVPLTFGLVLFITVGSLYTVGIELLTQSLV